jgi:hypothetical protein
MAELRVKVPIRFSEKAQKDLYETCMAYKKLAEMRGADNEKLRELVKYAYECAIHSDHATCDDCERINGCCILADRMRELGVEVEDEQGRRGVGGRA